MGVARRPIAHSHRAALRQHFQTADPKPTQAALRAWFTNQFGYQISQSIVSRSLGENFVNLDSTDVSESAYRLRSCQWPWLETLLTNWIEDVESRSGRLANEDIRRKARELWKQADESQGLVIPQFSVGWVMKFRRRHEMRLLSNSDQRQSEASPDTIFESTLIVNPDSNPDDAPEHALNFFPIHSNTREAIPCNFVPSTSETNIDFGFTDPPIPTFSPDHLIHLVQHNVFRALMANKSLILSASVVLQESPLPTPIEQFPTTLCGGLTVVHPLPGHPVPDTLYPTPLQMNCAHTGWINMFPFPRFRDNLIKKGIDFIPEEMCKDLFGDIFPNNAPPHGEDQHISQEFTLASSSLNGNADAIDFEDQDDFTAGRKCLITWDDPSQIESWEVTPGFLSNWGWAFEGCQDLIDASNRWRASRNEKLMNVFY
ncbi:hypothetical protein IFR05_004315 [Cadophora sp. M221]|nr:hypothetical protein IFR05_004315 [Cadophora sp. M221]